MPAVNQSPEETVTGDLRLNNNRKMPTLKAFEELEIYGSYSQNYSPESVDLRTMKSPAAVKDVNLRRVRNQIERIRAEDSHLGEDIGECLIARVCGAGHGFDDVIIIPRSSSPFSGGKVAASVITR